MKEKYYKVSPTISRWKIDSKFENFLAYKADFSNFWKWLYVKFYQIVDNQYYKGGVKWCLNEIERQRLHHFSIINQIGANQLLIDMISVVSNKFFIEPL